MAGNNWLTPYTGGAFDTNAFLAELADGTLLVDAPEGTASWIHRLGRKVDLLFLTHGHFDHVWDAAAVTAEHGCPVVCHADTLPMVSDPEYFTKIGFPFSIQPLTTPPHLIGETDSEQFLGTPCQVLLVPGHCPGSLCLLHKERRVLFGGDVLFAGGVGRWDLPAGDGPLLFRGIREKLFPLGDDITVLPGHGPSTTIGEERTSNPFVGDGVQA